ncbi:hypothetical protein CSH63_23855 [Micromonospora tulbaghiae]|uniref:Mandelate racemase n=1 Tax=Micromonospora tulbaghiae TaxID=479978 RepID=A0A386WPY8_9ACTN|nr:enolase C-terminal domain-like protein [Micromonospora tulbaghiae]AYF30427.1 hypothetical protein CSH63_23855 [Micromonospora tulbaghiae]
MASTIDAVRVLATNARSGDDNWFIALTAAGETGWYGPVNAEIGQYVNQVLADTVIGESPTDHHGIHTALRHAAHATAAVASWAVGAVDCAAWDLHGRLVQAPVADLLADSPEQTVPLYASWLGLDASLPTTKATVEQVGRSGWSLTKWGLRRRPEQDVHAEAARLAEATRAVATALGRAAAFDGVFTWDAPTAELVADRIDPANVLWLEDPLPRYDLEPYRLLAGKMPLGGVFKGSWCRMM